MFLPRAIAPFDVILTAANMDEPQLVSAAERIYEAMRAQDISVLYDDREERPGVKFKDADLIGVPYRVTLGKRKFEQGLAEIFHRSTKQVRDVKLSDVVECLKGEHLR
jgi:prolyl-tRNA synthetase